LFLLATAPSPLHSKWRTVSNRGVRRPAKIPQRNLDALK
jgi:hypothetical protein